MYRTRIISDRRVEVILAENAKLRNQVKVLSTENERLKAGNSRQDKEMRELVQRLHDIFEGGSNATKRTRKLHG